MKTRRQFTATLLSALAAPNIAQGATQCGQPVQGVRPCITGVPDVPIVMQECPQWCWAACAQLLFRIQGYRVPQRQFVQKVYGDFLNCQPATGPTIADAISGLWSDSRGTTFQAVATPLLDLGHFPQITHPSPMDVVRTELHSNRAIIAGTLGHAIAITALEYYEYALGQIQLENIIVRDPFPYENFGQVPPYYDRRDYNKFVMTPQQFFNGYLLMTVDFF